MLFRSRGIDRGFIMSDHADWPDLLTAIEHTGAERVFVTHGKVNVLVRYLIELGLDAQGFVTEYGDEELDSANAAETTVPEYTPENILENTSENTSEMSANQTNAEINGEISR